MIAAAHSVLKASNTFTQPAHHLGNFSASEEQHHNQQNNQPMERKELTHIVTSSFLAAAATGPKPGQRRSQSQFKV